MKISAIAAVLNKAAVDMQAFAAKNDDLNFPDGAVLPFVLNFLTDERLRKFHLHTPKPQRTAFDHQEKSGSPE
jgi:hypothetical protein